MVAERAPISFVEHFAKARLLVLGDLMLDRYITGQAARLSPEAPVPVLRPLDRGARLGGAANVALNAAALGAAVALVGVVGADTAGQEIAALLDEAPGIAPRLIATPDRPTTTKTRFLSGRHQLMRLDEETAAPVAGRLAEQVLAAFGRELAATSVVVLSDYAKGVLSDEVLEAALRMAERHGVSVVADPKRADFAAYRGVAVLTPNEAEARLATRIEAACDAGAERAGLAALDMTGGAAVLVTRSERGLTLVRRGEPPLHLPTRAREVADVSGAGDTLVATFAVAMASGAGLAEAAMLANAAAGVVVGKQGTASVTRAELQAALRMDEIAAADSKVLDREAAAARAAEWRAQGLRVGFANGCFDLIHPGHVRLLNQARAACDRLVVALNTDVSVRRLKGPSRPVQDETARATVMASLAPVDLVTLFDEDTPVELIRALRPEVLVKGSDYTEDQVVGADLVKGWGGRVLLVDLAAGHSTTGMVRRMVGVG